MLALPQVILADVYLFVAETKQISSCLIYIQRLSNW